MSEGEVIEEQQDRAQDLGHKLAPEGRVAIQVGNEFMKFQTVKLSDPVPTARQIINAAGFGPAEDYLIFAVSHDRGLIELKLDQTTEILGRGQERFLIFKSDRSWRGILNGKRFEWGSSEICGRVLKLLAGVNPKTHGVWLELRGESDRLIGDDETARLTPAGVERFRTELLILVCIEDEIYPWPQDTITVEEIAQLGGWDVAEGVIEVDEDQNERTLVPGEVIKLRPGLSFGKKLCFKRG